MPSVVRFTSSRPSEVVEGPLAPSGGEAVRLGTLYSGISPGTEWSFSGAEEVAA